MNYSYPTTIYESILAQIYEFQVFYFTAFAFYHEQNFKVKIAKNISFYQKYVQLGKNAFIHCSWITVVHVHVYVFSLKFTQRVTVTQTESNQEVTKGLISILLSTQNLYMLVDLSVGLL